LKIKKFSFLLYLLFSFLSPQGRIDGIAAVVGSNFVLYSDVLQQAQMQSFYQKIDPSNNPVLFEKIYNNVLESMINQYVVLSAAEKDTNLFVGDDEVDSALEQQISDFILKAGSEVALVEAVGMSMRKIRQEYWPEIRNMLLIERYKYSKMQNIDVSRVEVLIFFEDKKDSLPDIPESFDFSIIELPIKPGKSAETKVKNNLISLKELINNGASFDSLAIIYSDDPGSAPSGGNLGFTKRGSLVKEYEEAAYTLKVGEVSSPVRSQFGFHLIRLNEKLGEKISTQHILNIINPTPNDSKIALDSIRTIYYRCESDPFLFDSLALDYSLVLNNTSGKHKKIALVDIPSSFLPVLQNISEMEISTPFELDNGFAIICLHKHNLLVKPNPENSWLLLYSLAKSNKQNVNFQSWVAEERLTTFIKIFNE